MTEEQLKQEAIYKRLESQFEKQRESFYEFALYYWEKEKKIKIDENRHIKEICRLLEDVYYGKIKRLIINVPPRTFKTELVSRLFPARSLGKKNNLKFMGISYASGLSQDNSGDCRAIYESSTFKHVFPRIAPLKDDQNTKQHRENIVGGQYYASGATGTITGKGCDIMLIDDPLKPTDAMSDVVRIGVNNNYHNTLYSRLNNKEEGAIVIIMQRLHDDDLCGHLLDLEKKGGEKREKLIVKAVAEEDDEFRKQGETFFQKRFPLHILNELKLQDPQSFSSQYQQEPTNKDTQEFHEEWFRYHGTDARPTPKHMRIFTAVDPAFKQGQENDQTSIVTVGFIEDKAYILEITAGRFTADVMQDKIIYHIKKREPEKIGIEAFQAQSMIITYLKSEMQKQHIYADIEEIRQTGDKLSKIRKLITLYRNGLIYHNRTDCDELENELKKFPRGKHDDIVDSLQMVYNMYELQPNTGAYQNQFTVTRDINGEPIIL